MKDKAPWPGQPGGYVPILGDIFVAEHQKRTKMVLPWMQGKNSNLWFTGGGGKDTTPEPLKKRRKPNEP